MTAKYVLVILLSLTMFSYDALSRCYELPFTKISLKHAKQFELSVSKDGVYQIKVKRPWLNSSEDFVYYVSNRNKQLPLSCNKLIIDSPLMRVAALSTSHVAFLEAIDSLSNLVAFSNLNYVSSRRFQDLVEQKKIRELGFPLNKEIILNSQVEAVLAYSAFGPRTEGLDGIVKMKIPIIYIGEYREQTPLARLEWILFYGVLFDRLQLAKEYFDRIESNYLQLKTLVAKKTTRPAVLIGQKVGSRWIAPGDKSDFAQLIDDAGAQYIFSNNNSSQTLHLNFESVLQKALKAQYWITNNLWNSKEDIKLDDSRYQVFLFLQKHIYNNNKHSSMNGGNDYWEHGMVAPDLLLADLVKIFHPEIIPDHQFTWFQELN